MDQQHVESPELVLVAPPAVRAAALAALTPTTAAQPVAQEPAPETPDVLLVVRHPDLDRFGFLAQVPEREPARFWLRLAWPVAVSAAIALGAAAPVVVALLLR